MSSRRFYLSPCYVARTEKRMWQCLTACSYLFRSWCKDPFPDLISTPSPSLCSFTEKLGLQHVFSNLQIHIQHAYVDCHLQSAHRALQKLKFAPSCYSTYLGGLLTNIGKDVTLSSKRLLWCLKNTTRRLNRNLSVSPFISHYFPNLFCFSSLGTVDFIVLETS